MQMEFNQDLSEMKVSAVGDELAHMFGQDKDQDGKRCYTRPLTEKMHIITIINPVLVTDDYKIGLLGMPLSVEEALKHFFIPEINGMKLQPPSSVLRDAVRKLFDKSLRICNYGNTQLEFRQHLYPSVWGPSIDTFLFCDGVRREKAKGSLTHIKKAVEIGCGSGFISKYLLVELPNLEDMTIIDLNPEAYECARANIRDPRARFFVGDGLAYLDDRKYDLIVCNPPYIPRPKSIDDNAFEGVRVLDDLIRRTRINLTPWGVLLTNVSNLCQQEVDAALQRYHTEATAVRSLEVPLKVFNVVFNKEWITYLEEKKGLDSIYHEGHDYWQKITITKIIAK